MLDAKLRAALDQGMMEMIEMWPPMWKAFYEKCKEEGFTEPQAFDLVKTFILSHNPHGIRP